MMEIPAQNKNVGLFSQKLFQEFPNSRALNQHRAFLSEGPCGLQTQLVSLFDSLLLFCPIPTWLFCTLLSL